MTVGPWKPIKLEFYSNRLTDVDIRSEVSESLDVNVIAKVTSLDANGSVKVTLKSPDGSVKATTDNVNPDSSALHESKFAFAAGDVELWYPIGYGKQPLYTAVVQLFDRVSFMTWSH
jgi:beta-mannosidase